MRLLSFRAVAVMCTAGAAAAALVGCPPQAPETTGRAIILLNNAAAGGEGKVYGLKQGPVDVADIESFLVTVERVVLDRTCDDCPEPPQEEVFSGSVDVNLMDLQDVSVLLSEAEVPAGDYEKIRLSISNPRLVLKSDPGTEITDIHLTANSRLFVDAEFTVPAEGEVLIVLDFNGIHLVELGNGGYNLTPQLRADVDVESADVEIEGEITAIDTTEETITVALTDGEVVVIYTDADIFLPADTDTPTGVPADLAVGQQVVVTGVIGIDGVVTADVIVIQS